MKDILSPTTQHAYLDFDFSEFIDKNFDMSNDILPNTKPLLSPCNVSSSSVASTTHLDDLFSDTASNSNYTLEHSPSPVYLNNPLWSSIEELAYNTSRRDQAASLSCIDTFIKDPNSDLVELVQQSQAEHDLFQSLIIDSLMNYSPQYDYYQQQRINYEAQQRYYQEQHVMDLVKARSYTTIPPPAPAVVPANLPKKRKQPSATKRNSTKSSAALQYSSANNTQYTHSDQVNAQLLKELIRQAGRNAKHPMNSSLSFDTLSNKSSNISPPLPPPPTAAVVAIPSASMDLQQYTSPSMNGNYPVNHNNKTAYQTSLSNTSSSKYSHHLPYKIQTNATSKKSKQQKTHSHHPYQRSSSSSSFTSNSSNAMGKPSMYSSDMSQAQLLEIQAISRAQQDFIRAREQQEAEKELLMKHHHQHHQHSKKATH
ncbi:unnamed protein product [Mucor fragilis]